MTMNIAIDGPAGAGKSTVAQLTAIKLGYTYIDTGAMYRAVTLAAMRNGLSLDNEQELCSLLDGISISLKQQGQGQRVYVDHHDVTDEIRYPDVSSKVSMVAKHRQVRERLMIMQREMANQGNVVMDGRDIGTHVLPDAEVKIFLTASIEERAMRRYKELTEKGHVADIDQLKEDIALRDKLDSERESAPLRCADDAIVVDSTGLSIYQVVERIISLSRGE
jgi:cytidylate kinase